MKSATAFAVVLSLLPLALACCKQDKITSCCGKGKCNIFCCNCDGGCKPKDKCKGMNLPVCWMIPGPRPTTVCVKDKDRSMPDVGGPQETMSPREWFDTMDEETEARNMATLEADGFIGPEGDARIFREVDADDKGHFTYDEFLAFAGVEDEPEVRAKFDRFDRNSDGVITVDEMREPEDDDSPIQQDPRQRPVQREHEEL